MFQKLKITSIFAVSLLIISGCGGIKQVPINASFDLKYGNDTLEIKKAELYKQTLGELKNFDLSCVLSDKGVSDLAVMEYQKLVQAYPDPILLNGVAGSHKATISEAVDLLKLSLNKFKGEIFKTSGPYMSCQPTQFNVLSTNIDESSPTSGVITISSNFAQNCTSQANHTSRDNLVVIKFDISYSEISPGLIKFQTSGNLSYKKINGWSSILNVAALKRAISDASSDYASLTSSIKLNALKNDLKQKIADKIYYQRFESAKTGINSKSEKTYNIEFGVAISRIQRNLERFTFKADESSFTFSSQKQFSYCSYSRLMKYSASNRLKLFPESKGRTVVVFEQEYGLIQDKFLNKKLGEEDAQSEFKTFVSSVDNILKQQ